MARNKSPRKRKPVKSGRLPVTSRATAPVYPKRFMISLPPENDDDRPPEFFYDTLKEAIRHCVRLGPNFSRHAVLPAASHDYQGFEQRQDQADDAGYDYTEG
ncbi:hypothetical protein [Arsenophonus nasoniae]|uniref:Uncharacterized protein n=1 Tax=Arsenophonus nasoniae TaxID=638 RepID=A0A4P7LA87_9GAMM|nr:hypothetical protein [Arsenophonus nasoniae]QBY46728.1 hypothetical protein ArsFIN_53390 [Arsenophonus nasoniae]